MIEISPRLHDLNSADSINFTCSASYTLCLDNCAYFSLPFVDVLLMFLKNKRKETNALLPRPRILRKTFRKVWLLSGYSQPEMES